MVSPNISIHETLSYGQKKQILEIWNNEYPGHLKHANLESFNRYLEKLQDLRHYLVIDEQRNIKGWLATFDRNSERWFVMMICSSCQSKRIGSTLLDHAKQDELVLNGWVIDHNNDLKIDGSSYKSPLSFYTKNLFSILTDVRLEDEQLSAVKIQWKASDKI